MTGLTRRALLAGLASVSAAPASRAQPRAPASSIVTYRAINGADLQLRAFVGRQTALLIDPVRATNPVVTERILSACDRAWEWHSEHFSARPKKIQQYAGKVPIAEVSDAGLNSGGTGIEIAPSAVGALLTEASRDRYNQAPFFLMARNFWPAESQLGAIDALEVGFGHVHRFYSMDGARVTGAPYDENLDFDHYRHTVLIDMLNRYLADRSLNWQNTLAADKAPNNPNNWGAGELASAFYHRIRRDHGTAGYVRFWRMMVDAPEAKTPKECATRFVQIARAATGEDYRWLFRDQTLSIVY
jgi:hypothetical protein